MREVDAVLRKIEALVNRVKDAEFHLAGQHNQQSHGRGGGKLLGVGKSTDRDLLDADKAVDKLKVLGGGRSAARVALGFTKDGRQIVRKTNLPKDHVDKEFLVAKLGQALGAPVPNVVKRHGGIVAERAPGSAQGKWGQTPFRRILQPLKKSEIRDSLNAEGAAELGLLDYLTNNTDRRAANFMLEKRRGKNRVYGIDHTSSFWPQGNLQAKFPLSPFAERYVRGREFSPDDIAKIRRQVESIRPHFTRSKRQYWYDGVQRRIDSLESGYDLGTDYSVIEGIQTFAVKGQDGKVNIYTLDLDGNEDLIGFFRVVNGKIVQSSSDFVAELLVHFDNGDDALEQYSDWSNGWILTRLVED